jgi:hypothetical protein
MNSRTFHGQIAAVFVLGLFCAASPLAIIVLVSRSNAAWIIAVHRFFEVSVAPGTRHSPLH